MAPSLLAKRSFDHERHRRFAERVRPSPETESHAILLAKSDCVPDFGGARSRRSKLSGGPALAGHRYEVPILTLSDIGSRVVHAAHNYWRSKIQGSRLPSRRDIDPVEIPKLLPHVMLTEIRPEPFQARYRLAGTATVDIHGFDYTGTILSAEREGDEGYAYYLEIYKRLCREKLPLFGRDNARINNRHHIVFEWVELPLVDQRGDVAMTFAVDELFKVSSPSL